MVTDIVGEPLVGTTSFPTERDPERLVVELSGRIRDTLDHHPEAGRCEGVGVVVPGMVDRTGTRVLFAPRLGWHDVPFQEPLAALTGLPVVIENSGKACALAQAWNVPSDAAPPEDLVFLSVSDGLGVGVVTNGQLLRGQHNAGGEFGHMPLALEGPRCACGSEGCWEAHVEPRHRLALPGPRARPGEAHPPRGGRLDRRGRDLAGPPGRRARRGGPARHREVPRLVLAAVVNVVDPTHIYVSGEITSAWDRLGP